MTESELQDILVGTLESVKSQIAYTRNMQDAFSALWDAVAPAHPNLESAYKEELRKIRPNPVQDEHIQLIDALLAKLGKPQSQ